MIPYGHQTIDEKDKKAVLETLASDWLTQGPKVKEFEKEIARYVGAKFGVAANNGTSALHLAYLAAGLKKGDEVITTPNTFVATTNMLLAIGVKPVFCDIRPDTCNIDETKIEKLITKKTKAIVPVDIAGHPCALDKILKLARKHRLLVIEDASHALGASYQNKKIGSFADMTIFSFHPVKPITTGEGGMVVTDNEDFYKKMLHLRSHGIAKDEKGFNVMTELGYNYRLPDTAAALGLSQLAKLDKFIKARHQVVKWYEQELSGLPDIILPTELKDSWSGWHIYVIRTKKEADRLPLYRHLQERGIGVNFHYPAVYSHPYYQKHGYKNVSCPQMEKYEGTAITIPLYPGLKRSEVQQVCRSIKGYFASK